MNKKTRYLLIPHWIMGKRTSFKVYEDMEMYYILDFEKIFFHVDTISYIEGKRRHCIIHFIDGTTVTFPKSIGFFSAYLAGNHFGRFHRGFIMNFHNIIGTFSEGGCMVEMGNRRFIFISRRETAVFLETYGRFIKLKGIAQRRK